MWRWVLGAISFIVLCLTIGYVVYVKYVMQLAKLEVQGHPRVPMFECGTHGFFRKEQLIHHLDQDICPFCFDEQLKYKLDSTIIPFQTTMVN